jgi:hypothetical protein
MSFVKTLCVVSLLGISLASCGGGGDGAGGISGPSGPTYADISGTYAGAMAGNSQGILLQATFTLTITQTNGTLGGSYSRFDCLRQQPVSQHHGEEWRLPQCAGRILRGLRQHESHHHADRAH